MRTIILMLGLATIPLLALAQTPAEVRIGDALPDAMMQGLNGPARPLSAFRGMPLIINVWASWCGPCRAEMASLERLAWRDESDSFHVIGISTDDDPQQARAALVASNSTIAQFIDSKLVLEHMLGASRIPLTVLVDADGRVLRRVYGARDWDSASARQLIGAAFGR
jgi:thiol-disulfide isomerase/thioredoxin